MPALFEEIKKMSSQGKSDQGRQLINDYIIKCTKNIYKQNYLQNERGIKSEQLIDYFKLGFDSETNFIIMPSDPDERATFIERIASKEEKRFFKNPKAREGDSYIFNLNSIVKSDIIFITEGVIDSLSIYQKLLRNKNNIFENGVIFNKEFNKKITALGFNGSFDKDLINYILKLQASEKEKGTDELKNKIFIISLDNDPPNERGEEQKGKLKAKQLNEQLINFNCNCIFAKWSEEITRGDQKIRLKDTNDQLLYNTKFYDEIIENIKRAENYIEDIQESKRKSYITEKSSFLTFSIFLLQSPPEPIKTSFRTFANIIGGGIFPSFYTIGASSSLGKSTFLLNLALDIIRNNSEQDIFYFSLEMPSDLIFRKLISLISHQLYLENKIYGDLKGISNYTYRDIKLGKFINANLYKIAKDSENEFKKRYAKQFYLFERKEAIYPTTIKNEIEIYIETMKKKPLVIIDYLQIVDSEDLRQSDKQKTDYLINELKTIKNNFNIPIFAISSFNRENYFTETNLTSFKESGSIEYTSDYIFTLEPLGLETTASEGVKATTKNKKVYNEYLSQKESKVKLKVLKNREGTSRKEIAFNYDKVFNFFSEIGEAKKDDKGNDII